MTNTGISILMPSYNSQRFLSTAINSALAAMGTDDELVIQDGHSSDGTTETIAAIADADARVRYDSRPDGGQADALNRALSRSTKPWVVWLNADDIINPSALQTIRQSMKLDADVLYSDYSTIGEDGRVLTRSQLRTLTVTDVILGVRIPFSGSLAIKRSTLERIGGFNTHFHYCMDYELYVRLWTQTLKREHVPGQMGALRIYAGTKTTSAPWRFVSEARRARTQHTRGLRASILSASATTMHGALIVTTALRATPAYRKVRSVQPSRSRA